jgi:hypothetical protein
MNLEMSASVAKYMQWKWNEVFPDNRIEIESLPESTVKSMAMAYERKFENDIKKWTNYLNIAKTSSIIVMNPSLHSISALIDFKMIDNIRNGTLKTDMKQTALEEKNRQEIKSAVLHVNSLIEHKVEEKELIALRIGALKKHGAAMYNSYIKPCHLFYRNGVVDSREILMEAPSRFIQDRASKLLGLDI